MTNLINTQNLDAYKTPSVYAKATAYETNRRKH